MYWNAQLTRQQEPSVTKEKIKTVLERLDMLGTGEDAEDTADAQGSEGHVDPLVQVTSPSLPGPVLTSFLCPQWN